MSKCNLCKKKKYNAIFSTSFKTCLLPFLSNNVTFKTMSLTLFLTRKRYFIQLVVYYLTQKCLLLRDSYLLKKLLVEILSLIHCKQQYMMTQIKKHHLSYNQTQLESNILISFRCIVSVQSTLQNVLTHLVFFKRFGSLVLSLTTNGPSS